jgi:hypoxia up-regulated 1
MIQIESLMNDEDYRSRISRTQLEEACASFAGKFGGPIQDALSKAGLKLVSSKALDTSSAGHKLIAAVTQNDINSLILFGGNTRVPFVQTAIKAALGGNEDKIAQNVNTDEAAVLGAAYYGASQGRSVVSKLKLKVVEGLGWDVAYSLVDGQNWKVVPDEITENQVLFPAGTNHTSKRVLTLARTTKAQPSDSLSVKFAYTGGNA